MFKNFYYFFLTFLLLGASGLISPSLYANRDFSVTGRRHIARAEERKNAKSNAPLADNGGDDKMKKNNQNSKPNRPLPPPRQR